MTITAPRMTPIHEPTTEAILVIETYNSIYAITVGRSYSRVTCVKGTLAGEVADAHMSALSDEILATWSQATGITSPIMGAQPRNASERINIAMSNRPFRLETHIGNFSLTEVMCARWVLTQDEILHPNHMKTRNTALVHAIAEGYDEPVPMTSLTCWACGHLVDLTLPENQPVRVCRVGGDSRWGYEPAHRECIGE